MKNHLGFNSRTVASLGFGFNSLFGGARTSTCGIVVYWYDSRLGSERRGFDSLQSPCFVMPSPGGLWAAWPVGGVQNTSASAGN